jgi:ParB/RepB/Spo0J family partition protein
MPIEKPNAKTQKKGSGHELDKLLSGNVERNEKRHSAPAAKPAARIEESPDENKAIWVELEKLHDNPYQPRRQMHSLELLALIEGIDRVGQLQAAIATPHPTRPGHYILLAGHRRKYAVKEGTNAGIHLPNPQHYIGKLRVEVRKNLSDFDMMFIAAEENENRDDVPVIDRAHHYKKIKGEIEADKAFLNGKRVTWADVESRLGRTYRRIHQILELLDLPEWALKYFYNDDKNPLYPGEPLNERHGRALLILKHDEGAMRSLLRAINAEKLSGNRAEKRAQEMRDKLYPSQLDLDVHESVKRQLEEEQERDRRRTAVTNKAALDSGKSHLSLVKDEPEARGTEGSGFVTSPITSSRSVIVGAENAGPEPPAWPQDSPFRSRDEKAQSAPGYTKDALHANGWLHNAGNVVNYLQEYCAYNFRLSGDEPEILTSHVDLLIQRLEELKKIILNPNPQ